MKRSFNKEVGRRGEQAAADYLVKKGWEVIARNFAIRYGEIDLVCRDGEVTVFVEVKTKKGLAFGRPEEMFTRGKYERVKRMAEAYLEGKEVPCRIDMVAVELGAEGEVEEIRHYENVDQSING